MRHNDYDKIAWCYDVLCGIVFGNTIKKAQEEILNFIPANSHILVAGGGTGWILERIVAVHSSGLRITYIDASLRMIEKSMKRNTGLNQLTFIGKAIQEVALENSTYDVIITSFFFDNFPETESRLIFEQLHVTLKDNGIWLFTDFTITKHEGYWQKPFLNIMYLFFKWTCRLQAKQLAPVIPLFSFYRYKKIFEKIYYRRFINSFVYRKCSTRLL